MGFTGKLNVNGVELPVTGVIDRENKWGYLEAKIDVMLQPTLHCLKIGDTESVVITPYQSGNRCRHEFRLREVNGN